MNQGIVVAILSFLLYLANLFSGGAGQPIQLMDPPLQQQSYHVLGLSGRIVADSVTVRRAPQGEADVVGTIEKNTSVTVLDESGTWYKVRPISGAEGWIPDYAVEVTKNSPKEQEQVVLGYYPNGDVGYESLLEHGSKLTSLAPLGWKLDSYGHLQADFDPEEMGRSLHFAGNQEMDTYAHLEVTTNPSRLLDNAYLQENSIDGLIETLTEWGLKGVLVDIAYLPGSEQNKLFSFIDTLNIKLAQEGYKSMIALPWDETVDYETASRAADYLVLKGVQPHSSQEPGPIASLPETKAMLQEIVELVPAEKLILALTTSGLDWPRAGLPTSLSHGDVLELAAKQGANVRWDVESRSPFFSYGAGHEVWFENRYSIKYKLELAQEYQLGGIALMNLGQEDPEIWETLAQLLVG